MRLRGFRFLHYLSHPCSGPQSRDDTHISIHTQSCPTTCTHTQLLPTTQAHNMTLHPHKATYNLDPTSLSHSSILPACSLSSIQLTPKCSHTRNLITVSHSGPPSPTLAYVTGPVDFSPSNSLGCFGPRHSRPAFGFALLAPRHFPQQLASRHLRAPRAKRNSYQPPGHLTEAKCRLSA